MTLRGHHAHVCIGEANDYSKDIVLSYLRDENHTPHNTEFRVYQKELFTVDDARDLKQIVSQKPSDGKQIVILIVTTNFSREAQNALLKTLEDPFPGVMVIFITPKEHTLLPTLRSRVLLHYLTQAELVSPIDINLFKKGTTGRRLKLVDEYLQKIKDDEALHETSRKDALAFLNAYEALLYTSGTVKEYKKEFEAILYAKDYLQDSGSSVKQLLEYVALSKDSA